MAREPGTSFPSETRQMVRQDRLKLDGGGPHGLVVILVALAVIGGLVYAFVR
jgi:hypothetical protein